MEYFTETPVKFTSSAVFVNGIFHYTRSLFNTIKTFTFKRQHWKMSDANICQFKNVTKEEKQKKNW